LFYQIKQISKNIMKNQEPVMPKTHREQLNELELGGGKNVRASWASFVSDCHKGSPRRFTLRTDPLTRELRLWRLK
jgi:hypothetical protein